MALETITASCRCGKLELEIAGPPIMRGICYCRSCQKAGGLHQAVTGADLVRGDDGGTDYLLYRKDRVRCVKGTEFFEERKLKPDSPTRRMFARCCNTAMFLDFTKGHWLTIYRGRIPGEVRQPDMRVMTNSRPEGVSCPTTSPATSAPR